MNKTELVSSVAEKAGISKTAAAAAVDAVFSSITDAMASGDKVTLIGFGTFEAKQRNEHTAKNPQTGEKIVIQAKKVPVFKAGSVLKKVIAE